MECQFHMKPHSLLSLIKMVITHKYDLNLEEALEEALRMEKEQIEQAFDYGYDNGHVDSGKEPEEYYNENYGNDNGE